MAEYRDTVICSEGKKLLQAVVAGLAGIHFTSIKTSSTQYAVGELDALTDIGTPVQESAVTASVAEGREVVSLYASFSNEGLMSGYYVRNFGIFAQDPDDPLKEILYAVVNADESSIPAAYVPAYAGKGVSGIDFECAVTVGSAESVTVSVDPSSGVSAGAFNSLAVKVTSHLESGVSSENGVHGIRYREGALQAYDTENGTWEDISGAGGASAAIGSISMAEEEDVREMAQNLMLWDEEIPDGTVATDDEIEEMIANLDDL